MVAWRGLTGESSGFRGSGPGDRAWRDGRDTARFMPGMLPRTELATGQQVTCEPLSKDDCATQTPKLYTSHTRKAYK